MRAPKTIEVLELRVGYVKNCFGKLHRKDIKRPDVLAFIRSYETDRISPGPHLQRSLRTELPQCNYSSSHFDAANCRPNC